MCTKAPSLSKVRTRLRAVPAHRTKHSSPDAKNGCDLIAMKYHLDLYLYVRQTHMFSHSMWTRTHARTPMQAGKAGTHWV